MLWLCRWLFVGLYGGGGLYNQYQQARPTTHHRPLGGHPMSANIIDMHEYRATERANARMMDTTIWQAMRITGMSDKDYRTSEIFHRLFELYLAEEMAA